MVAVLLSILSLTGCSLDEKSKEANTIDMGAIGNKITVDGTIAYIVGENKILVSYDFYGNFSECNSAVYSKSLKGCKNSRLPTDETDDLPEKVVREIISFYGNTGGFWTSMEVSHANIELVGDEPNNTAICLDKYGVLVALPG